MSRAVIILQCIRDVLRSTVFMGCPLFGCSLVFMEYLVLGRAHLRWLRQGPESTIIRTQGIWNMLGYPRTVCGVPGYTLL